MAIFEGIVDIRTLEVLFSVFLPPDGARQFLELVHRGLEHVTERVHRALASYPADLILILLDGHSSMRSCWDNANDNVEGGREGCRELGRELRRESPQFEDDLFSPFRNSSFLKLTFSFENIFRSGTF